MTCILGALLALCVGVILLLSTNNARVRAHLAEAEREGRRAYADLHDAQVALYLSRLRAEMLEKQMNRLLHAGLQEATGPALSADELSRLLRLCHPDLHPPARQAEATALTARLNALRAKDSTKKSGRRT